MHNHNMFFSSLKSKNTSALRTKVQNTKDISSIQKLLTKRYVQNKNISFISNELTCFNNQNLEYRTFNKEEGIFRVHIKYNETEKRPNWWRGSENEDILDPCFKKPIYSGRSNFNFLPKFLNDNMSWFKHRRLKLGDEIDLNYSPLDKKSIIEHRKQQRMLESQENSQYRYISPYSEYLLERIKWKIALRIYYTLDSKKEGYIELEKVKNKLFKMLKTDTEKAQSLLLLIETITPFLVKNGYIEKDDVVKYLAKEISEETRGYGLFSDLKRIFKSPILRKRIKQEEKKIFRGFSSEDLIEKKSDFSLDPEEVRIKISNTKFHKIKDKESFIGCCNSSLTNHNTTCLFQKNNCITTKLKNRSMGNLEDHIKKTLERKEKLIEKIREERRIKEEENYIECTFKPEILWPIGSYVKKLTEQIWSNRVNEGNKKYIKNKKEELINGYKIVDEQNINDPNIEVSLSNLSSKRDFDPNKQWNGYIHDSINNQIYILHKGYIYEEGTKNYDFLLYRKEEENNANLYSIAMEIENEFLELEKKEIINQKKKNSTHFVKNKLIDVLRSERKKGTIDPRFNNPEYTMEIGIPEFSEKIVDINKLEPYKEMANHEREQINVEYISKQNYYYFPKGYEMIGDHLGNYQFGKKLCFKTKKIIEQNPKQGIRNEEKNQQEQNSYIKSYKNNSINKNEFRKESNKNLQKVHFKNQIHLKPFLKSTFNENCNSPNNGKEHINQSKVREFNKELGSIIEHVSNKTCLFKENSQNICLNDDSNAKLNSDGDLKEFNHSSKSVSSLLKNNFEGIEMKKSDVLNNESRCFPLKKSLLIKKNDTEGTNKVERKKECVLKSELNFLSKKMDEIPQITSNNKISIINKKIFPLKKDENIPNLKIKNKNSKIGNILKAKNNIINDLINSKVQAKVFTKTKIESKSIFTKKNVENQIILNKESENKDEAELYHLKEKDADSIGSKTGLNSLKVNNCSKFLSKKLDLSNLPNKGKFPITENNVEFSIKKVNKIDSIDHSNYKEQSLKHKVVLKLPSIKNIISSKDLKQKQVSKPKFNNLDSSNFTNKKIFIKVSKVQNFNPTSKPLFAKKLAN